MSGQYGSRPAQPGAKQSARRRAGVILAVVAVGALIGSAGCSKSSDKAAGNHPVVPSTPTATVDTTSVVPVATLLAITLPVPKTVPASGAWSDYPPPTGGDGDRDANFVDGSDYWLGVRFLDCNLPTVKKAVSEPASERGDFSFCFDAPTGKLGDFPLYSPGDSARAVKLGHLVLIAHLGATGETKLKAADLEAFLKSFDLAALAKL